MRNSLFIFKPPNQRENIIDKCRECDKDPIVFTPTTFRHTKRLPIRISRPSHKKFHFKNDLQLATGTTVSTDTIRRRLSEAELKPYRPATVPVLTAAHRRARLQFVHRHADWQIEDWRHVLFTDKSRFCLSTNDRRRRVWRRPGERFVQCAIQEVERFGGGSVMVWGGITFEDRTNLVVLNRGSMTAVTYRDDIIVHVVKSKKISGVHLNFWSKLALKSRL
jgi:hypothetical protein